MIPNVVFLWVFLAGFLLYLTLNIFIIYHVVRFAYLNVPTRTMMVVNVVVTLGAIVLVIAYGWNVDWQDGIRFDQLFESNIPTQFQL